jgi:peptidoglycan hydrolase-like protein with peptidoglycan-binding domain
MIRTLTLAAGVLLGSLAAGTAMAQSTATAKPAPSPTMQHKTTPTTSKSTQQDSTKVSAKTTTHHATWTKEQIKEAQEGLAKAGYFKGTATGNYGKKTRAAIKAYQKANNLPVNGRLSEDLLNRLKSA